MARKPIDVQIAQAKARLADLQARASKAERSAETRRKIVLGATVELAMQADPEFRERVVGLLREKVTRPVDQIAVAKWLSTT